MADPPRYPEAGADSDVGADRESTGTPRWVKVSGLVVLALVILFVVVIVTGGGGHGPGRHALSDGGLGGHTPGLQRQRTWPAIAMR